MNGYVNRVGVVGAGVIGSSVAQAVARSGIEVVLQDASPEALATARRSMATGERLARLRKGPGQQAPVTFTGTLADLAGCDLVIENVTEDITLKEEVHRALDAVISPECVVAVNTSAVPVTRLALATGHPGRMVGAHFMNPVSLIDTVEVIRPEYADDDAVKTLQALLERMGKASVVVADMAGFVINRCLMMFINEAADLCASGVATPAEADRLFRGCLGHKSGPLRTADLIGIDTIVRTLEVLARYYGPARFTPAPVLLRMIDAGRLGCKTGQGFYVYTAEGEH
ncbi:3-hydroxyacyl-CoA dehydrogenase family protein [Streptantibioticus silvisoli]|uniref:3-hydroxyacyl-CoA dehydrogenase family protein n=1 Tax=Streptantibioticus silvisoli TaxID=2705255 RepID=A0ABT6VTJ6_9ACTN|nr:3-hydroxyacyl-CoA dehydrogenase family protein [Streptantibioticus silvisoli]MDI5961384.1 3-hydroxyacyl-CoA dehydrogenase family protein [Streptantibioticus silvisoli]